MLLILFYRISDISSMAIKVTIENTITLIIVSFIFLDLLKLKLYFLNFLLVFIFIKSFTIGHNSTKLLHCNVFKISLITN